MFPPLLTWSPVSNFKEAVTTLFYGAPEPHAYQAWLERSLSDVGKNTTLQPHEYGKYVPSIWAMSVYFRLFPPLRTWLTYDVIGNTPIYFLKHNTNM